MRRSLAPHAHVPTVPLDTPEVSALRQRAERAERNAAGWYRLAIVLTVACALLVLTGCDEPERQAGGDLRMMVVGCKPESVRHLRNDEADRRTMVITCVPKAAETSK